MSARTDSKHTISAFFLRTVQHAENFERFLGGLLSAPTIKKDHTIVYIEHRDSQSGNTDFDDISTSLDAFNLNFIRSAENNDWLENYQTERSMGVFMMRKTQTNDILATVHGFRIDCLVRLNQQIEAYSTITSESTSLPSALISKTGLGQELSKDCVITAVDEIGYKLSGFDFIDYSQLFEDVIRPIATRTLKDSDNKVYNKALSEMLLNRQNMNTQGLVLRNTVFKHFADTLHKETELDQDKIPNFAMQLTQGYFAVKSAEAMYALRDAYQVISMRSELSVNALLKPVRLHRESIGLTGFAKTA